MADEVKNNDNPPAPDEQKTAAPDAAPATAAPVAPTTPASRPPAAHGRPPHAGGQRSFGGPRREGGPRPGGPGGPRGDRKFFRRKKVCKFCVEKIDSINYKDVGLLKQFVAERGKIVPRRLSGVCTPHQRRLTAAIKQARNIALLPFAARF